MYYIYCFVNGRWRYLKSYSQHPEFVDCLSEISYMTWEQYRDMTDILYTYPACQSYAVYDARLMGSPSVAKWTRRRSSKLELAFA